MFKKTISILILTCALPALVLAHGGSHKKVTGTISRIESAELHVTTKDGHDTHVVLTSTTSFVNDKKKASRKDAKVGMRVVVELTSDGKNAEKVHLGKMSKVPQKQH